VSEEDRRRIPADGPVVVVANHPTGAIEGIGVAALLDSVRRDVRTLSHVWFGRYPEIARGMILVDPNAGAREPAGAAVAARESARWVRRGGLLTVYPAGEVARFRLRSMGAVDSPWRPGVARILRATRATVLPVYIDGRNRLPFYLLSMLHRRLGALLLVRELLAKRGTALSVRIGPPIRFEELPAGGDDQKVTAFLRGAVERLRPQKTASSRSGGRALGEPVPTA
jgi:putative hemolysin